jgi:hypothetical protein
VKGDSSTRFPKFLNGFEGEPDVGCIDAFAQLLGGLHRAISLRVGNRFSGFGNRLVYPRLMSGVEGVFSLPNADDHSDRQSSDHRPRGGVSDLVPADGLPKVVQPTGRPGHHWFVVPVPFHIH